MDAFLLASYIISVGLQSRQGDKTKTCMSTLSFTSLVWALVICVFSSILLCVLAFLVLGWFKLSSFFYYQRFGYKKSGGFISRNSTVMDTTSKTQAKTSGTAGEGPSETEEDAMRKEMMESEASNIVGRSMS